MMTIQRNVYTLGDKLKDLEIQRAEIERQMNEAPNVKKYEQAEQRWQIIINDISRVQVDMEFNGAAAWRCLECDRVFYEDDECINGLCSDCDWEMWDDDDDD